MNKTNYSGCSLIIDTCASLMPDISIMIPTFKRPGVLRESILSAIDQASENYSIEIVVIDNNPSFDDEDIVKNLVNEFSKENIRLFRNESNIGMYGNWNRCLELARGEWLTILNDDDLLFNGCIESLYRNRKENKLVVADYLKFSSSSELPEKAKKLGRETVDVYHLNFMFGHIAPGSLGILLNTHCARNIGGFDSKFFPTSDFHYFYKYFLNHGGVRIKEKLAGYRWGLNESLKPEIIKAFMINDYFMWAGIIENRYATSFVRKWLMIELSKYLTFFKVHKYKNELSKEQIDMLIDNIPYDVSFVKRYIYGLVSHEFILKAFSFLRKSGYLE